MNYLNPFLGASVSLVSRYLNAFDIQAQSGRLTVPRLIAHDDLDPWCALVQPETLREENAHEVVEEMQEMWNEMKGRLLRSSDTSKRVGSWKVFHFSAEDIRFEGPGGRLVEWSSKKEEFELTVGWASPGVRGEDRHARMKLGITRFEREPQFRTAYDFGFDATGIRSLLEFLGVDGDYEHFEWFPRRHLERGFQERMEDADIRLHRFRNDQHTMDWKILERGAQVATGYLWPDSHYTSLDINFPVFPQPLYPSLMPLWDQSVRRVRELSSPAVRRPAQTRPETEIQI